MSLAHCSTLFCTDTHTIETLQVWHQVGQFECIKHDLVAAVDEDNPVFYARRNQQSNFVAWQEDDPNKARLQRAPQLFDGTNAATDRSTIPRPDTPYKCGVVWFYHIPCTGGNSINRWFREYKSPQYGNISYYQGWALETLRDGTFCKNPQRVEDNFAKGMLNHVQNLGPTEWRIAHSHLVDFYLNESEDLLNLWRSEVEAQNCEFISSIMIRDPLNHALSLHKIVKSKNSTQEKWAKHLESPTKQGLWATVLDFFLYNNQGNRQRPNYPRNPGGRNPFNVSKEEKVSRAMELLARHFDIVTMTHDVFRETIINWTGLEDIPIPHSNVFRGKLTFSKREVENLQRGLKANGDADFFHAVKRKYHGYLSYLDS